MYLICLMMLEIHRSDSPSIDAVIGRFATTAARRLNCFNMNIYMYPCTRYSTMDSFLKIDMLNT